MVSEAVPVNYMNYIVKDVTQEENLYANWIIKEEISVF